MDRAERVKQSINHEDSDEILAGPNPRGNWRLADEIGLAKTTDPIIHLSVAMFDQPEKKNSLNSGSKTSPIKSRWAERRIFN